MYSRYMRKQRVGRGTKSFKKEGKYWVIYDYGNQENQLIPKQ